MTEVGREIRELFDEVADPIDIRGIVALERRRGWRSWQIALAAGFAALLIVGGVVLFGSVDSGPVAGPLETSRSQDPPYLGLDLEGWGVTAAGERTGGCAAPHDVIGVYRQVSYEPVLPVGSGPIHVTVHVLPAAIFCTNPMPLDAADLGPPAGPPAVNDHGFIQVQGNRARVFDTEGTFHVQWLIGTTGVGTLQIFGNNLTLEDAVAIAGGVVELGSDQWQMMLALFPDGGTTTTIAPLDAVDESSLPHSPLSGAVLEAVGQIPELAALTVEQATDHTSTGDEPGEWGGVSLLAEDGSRIEIVTQVVPDDFDPILAIGPDTQETGPNGEKIFLRGNDAVYQVVVIGQNGTMINVIIDRFSPSRTPGDLSDLGLDQARDWAVLLLDLITD